MPTYKLLRVMGHSSSKPEINPQWFFSCSDKDALELIHKEFGPELERVQRAYAIHDYNGSTASTPSPSHILYGAEYDEINRSLVAILTLRWLHNGQYETLVGNQPERTRLTRESFNWARDFVIDKTKNPEDLYALVTAVVINDLGKDPELAHDYCKLTGEDISQENHDMVLLKAVDIRLKGINADLVPCVNRLSPKQRNNLRRGLELGSQFNFGQLAQAEDVPASLATVKAIMDSHSRSLGLHFLEQILDVAGADGHMDWSCAKRLNEPVFSAFRDVFDAVNGIISKGWSLRQGYDLVLVRRDELLRNKAGFRALDVGNDSDRALLRLLCMGRVSDLDTAQLYDETWRDLEEAIKSSLIHALNVDGSVKEPAVQVTYIPALLSQAVNAAGSASRETKQVALRSLLRYLERVMSAKSMPNGGMANGGGVTVIERNVRMVLKNIVQTDEFRKDPTILEKAEIPDITVANTA